MSILLLVAIAIGCGGAAPPATPPAERRDTAPAPERRDRLLITTDRTHYELKEGAHGPEVVITATLHAPDDVELYLANCNGIFGTGLQKRHEGEWVHAWSQGMSACRSAPIIIKRGEKKTTTIVASWGHASSNPVHLQGGTYRVGWHGLYTRWDRATDRLGEEVPLEQRFSAPFTIASPPVK